MNVRFADHASFQRVAFGMAGGGLVLGGALAPVTRWAPVAGGILGIAAGAAIGHGRPVGRLVLAGGALALLLGFGPSVPALAAVAGLGALGLAIGGPREGRGLLAVLIGAACVLVAMGCALRIASACEAAGWPPVLASAAGAAALGLVGALATLPRHLQVARDPVRAALACLPPGLEPDVQALCDRAAAIWHTTHGKLADPAGAALLRDGVLAVLAVAARSTEVAPSGPSEPELARRSAELDERIATAGDGEARAQYERARGALADQQRYRDHIRQGRERVVARMHHHVAVLETFALAATGLLAARAASTGAPAVKHLEELSSDVAASGEALAELAIGEAQVVLGSPPEEACPR